LFENPPYAEVSIEHRKQEKATNRKAIWKNSYAVGEMKKAVKGTASNDLGSVFIWSGFKYYLRQPTDSFIVFSPVKYWKALHLVNKQFLGGYAFNRRHFHTNIDACTMCALWANVDDDKTKSFNLTGYDIVNDKLKKHNKLLSVKRIYSLYSDVYFDKRKTIAENDTKDGIAVALDGSEKTGVQVTVTKYFNENMVGYMCVAGTNFDNPDLQASLLIASRYEGHGFYLRRDNYLEKLPMFCASRYITYNREWTERARIMKSADGAVKFNKDVKSGDLSQFLLKCLLFACLELQNHMRTFRGSDGRFYRNKLCLDDTNGSNIALRDIKKLKKNKDEKALTAQWETVLKYAKQVQANERGNGYDSNLTYGVYQIYAELDTSYKDETTDKTVYDNVELHSALAALKGLVSAYYNAEIVPTLFKYEFLK
jgi:hypothetical protein